MTIVRMLADLISVTCIFVGLPCLLYLYAIAFGVAP